MSKGRRRGTRDNGINKIASHCLTAKLDYDFSIVDIQQLTAEYASKSDKELLRLALNAEALTPEAKAVLLDELATRRINTRGIWKLPDNDRSKNAKIAKAPRSLSLHFLLDLDVQLALLSGREPDAGAWSFLLALASWSLP